MNATYYLAIDVGTTRTSAAVAHLAPDGSPLVTGLALGRHTDSAPTVAFVADGELLFGDAAERRGGTQPDRLIREFKRRVGDDVPILAGDRAFTPEELYALMVDWAARAVIERQGATPERIAITVPAAWGDYRSSLVRNAVAILGWRDVAIISEPEAAARHYEATNPLRAGHSLAVYDFGGGTFDAVVLRKTGEAVEPAAAPVGITDLGGADFDDLVVRHVIAVARVDATTLAGDAAGRLALAALRRECVDAKESLSYDSEAVIPVILSGDQRTVRLTRDEFESMIDDDLERTVSALDRAVEDAGVHLDTVDAILLTGGSSRIPRVAQVLSERFDRPIAMDADPKAIIAMGAARAILDADLATRDAVAHEEDDEDAVGALFSPDPSTSESVTASRRSWFRRVPPAAYAAAACAALLTAAGVLSAPALGSSDITAGEWRATGLLAVGSDPIALPSPSAEPEDDTAAEPTIETAVDDEPTTPSDRASAPRQTGPRGPSRTQPTPRTSPSSPSSPRQAPASPNSPAGSSGTAPTTAAGTATNDQTPADPAPADPVDPAPVDTEPTDPGPVDPGPVDPGPVDPTPVDPGPTDPAPTDPDPTEPPPDPVPDPDPAPTGDSPEPEPVATP